MHPTRSWYPIHLAPASALLFAASLSVCAISTHALVLGPCDTIPLGMRPGVVLISDLDGDFDPDILSLETVLDGNQVAVLVGHGDGTFTPPVRYVAGLWPTAIATADMNGDSKLDVLTCNRLDGTVSLLLGNGDGTLGAPVSHPVGSSPHGLVARDLTGDGIPDFATTQAGSVVLRRGMGLGVFHPEDRLDASPLVGLTGVAAGDVNGDGMVDLVAISAASGGLAFFAGTTGGGFAPAVISPTEVGVNSVLLPDHNNDGLADVLLAGSDPAALCSGFGLTRLGQPGGVAATQTVFTTSCGTLSLAVGDLDMDGQLDVAAGNNGALELFVPASTTLVRGNGDGSFSSFTGVQPCGVRYAAIGDLDRDGWPDLVTAGNLAPQLHVQLNQTGLPTAIDEPPVQGRTLSVRVAPNPARGDVAVRVTTPRAGEVLVRVLDAAGRLVRDLSGGQRAGETRTLHWDRRIRSGAVAAPGLYFLEVRCGGDRTRARLLLLR